MGDSHLPRSVVQDYEAARKAVQSYQPKAVSLNPLRVNMLDATMLDTEMMTILRDQFVKIFRYTSWELQMEMTYEDEVDLLLHAVIFWFTVAQNAQTPGANLQNLHYINRLTKSPELSRRTRFGYFIGSVFLRWLFRKFVKRLRAKLEIEHDDQTEAILKWLDRLDSIMKILNFLHLCYFLRFGGPRTILERILNIELVFQNPQRGRAIVYEYMHNRLIWESATDFILFLFPLINFRRVWLRIKQVGNFFGIGKPAHLLDDFEINKSCPICGADPIAVPVRASCGHIFCYYCLGATLMESNNYRCELCSTLILSYNAAKPEDLNGSEG